MSENAGVGKNSLGIGEAERTQAGDIFLLRETACESCCRVVVARVRARVAARAVRVVVGGPANVNTPPSNIGGDLPF